jgi:ribosome-associated toxin RatA of RatAB toxin-antitoxin module
MTTGTEENKEGLLEEIGTFSEEEMMNYSGQAAEDEEDADIDDFPDFDAVPGIDANEEEQEEEEEQDDQFNFEGATEEEKIDLEAFNKKFDKDFKTEEELKNFMSGKENADDAVKEDDLLDKANAQIEMLEPILPLGNEDLMRKQFESIAMGDGKNLNDEDVQISIEEDIQDLKDKRVLDINADHLRSQLKELVAQSKTTRDGIIGKREEKRLADEKVTKEQLQNEFVKLHGAKSFYGIDIDKKTIADVYRKVSSGKFIEELQSDKQAIAELALMHEYKDKIFSKASGLTYSDGLKAVVDEFKSKPKPNRIAEAQTKGSTGSTGGSNKLIEGLLK